MILGKSAKMKKETTLVINRLSVWGLIFATVTLQYACSSPPVYVDEPAAEFGSSDYLIGPGDTLRIFVWRNPEISTTVPVRPDGKISTPLVEDMVAVGKTPTELARNMEEVLAEYIRSPTVNVIVQDFVGTFGEQVRVVGQATRPRSLPHRDRLTLLDVMIEVGGLTNFAAGNRAKVIRRDAGGTQEIRVRLDDLLNKGDMSQNLEMRPGDIVVIPEAIF